VLIIGGGKMGTLSARNLVSRGAEVETIASRTVETELVLRGVEQADVVVSSTSTPGYVLTRAQMESVLASRKGRPLFLIDIAVPRDLDPEIHELEGCYLYDIDDLESVVAESLDARRREATRAEAIVAEEAARFREWQAGRDVVPEIASLRARAEAIRSAELERARGRLGRLTEAERLAVESITSQIVNKLLHLPTVRMKEAAAGADGTVYADAVRHLFGLDDER
jgi:glutamyl-tRNA reductase